MGGIHGPAVAAAAASAALVGVLVGAGAARATGFDFTAVSRSGGAAPTGGTFSEFGVPSLDRGRVAFRASTSDRLGIFLSDAQGGGLAGVVDTTVVVPGGVETFFGFGTLSLDGDEVAFVGSSETFHHGIYRRAGGGAVGVVADIGMALEPGSDTTFSQFADVSLHAGRVGIVGGALVAPPGPLPGEPAPSPILLSGVFAGAPATGFSVVAAGGTAAPPAGAGDFVFGFPATCCVPLDGEQAVFSPLGPAGIYAKLGAAAVTVVANGASNIAGDGTAFDVIDRPANHKGLVVFTATSGGSGRQGVYVAGNGGFQTVADTTTLVPGGGGATFLFFGQPSIHNGAVAFKGCGSHGLCGIYTTLGGTLAKVVAETDVLDGKTVTGLEAGREAISCSSVAFQALFADSQGVYRADLVGGAGCPRGLQALGPAKVWAGLKNSDDQGTAFDFRVEARVNDALVAAGEALCVRGLTRNPALARRVEVTLAPFDPVDTGAGDVLAVTLLVRIGTDGSGTRCGGRGASHTSAVGVRAYFDSTKRASGITLTQGDGPGDLFLRASGPACAGKPSPRNADFALDDDAPTADRAKCRDSAVVKLGGGNSWKPIGSWSITLP
jgi:hypothetical protein